MADRRQDAQGAQKYIVCNADEGDSGTFADRMLMEGDPFLLIEGMAIAGEAVGADKGYIYVRSEYPDAIAQAREGDRALRRASSRRSSCEVRVGAGAYVCGEETSLLNSLEGKRGEVRAKPPLPAIEGLFGKPTVVNNVLTLAAVPHILAEGGASAYEQLGLARSKGTMPIQLAGNIKYGGLFETAFGVTLGELVNDIGGGTESGRPVKAVQVGGPLGAYIHPDQFDIKFDYEEYTAADALIGHGGITVFDDTADMGAMARFAMEFCAAESCGKCTPCRIGAVRGVEIIDRIRAGGRTPDHVERLDVMHNAPRHGRSQEQEIGLLTDLCETMKFGSLCALGGFTPFPVMSALKHWPEDFTGKAAARSCRRLPIVILGVVLAGGQSTRFGSDKALAELGGRTLLARAFDTLGGFCEFVVVAGRDKGPGTSFPTGRAPAWARSPASPRRCTWRRTRTTKPCSPAGWIRSTCRKTCSNCSRPRPPTSPTSRSSGCGRREPPRRSSVSSKATAGTRCSPSPRRWAHGGENAIAIC